MGYILVYRSGPQHEGVQRCGKEEKDEEEKWWPGLSPHNMWEKGQYQFCYSNELQNYNLTFKVAVQHQPFEKQPLLSCQPILNSLGTKIKMP